MEAAHSYGLSRRKVMVRDVIRNASPPVLNLAAMTFGYLIGGAVLVEVVFSWPGIGSYAVWDGVLRLRRSSRSGDRLCHHLRASLLHRGPVAVCDGSARARLTGDGHTFADRPQPPSRIFVGPTKGRTVRRSIFYFILLIVIFGPWIVTHDPIRPDPFNTLAPPSAEHWFGTDHLGLDIYRASWPAPGSTSFWP